jgi:predicted lipoprotein with Yx(FWY)xxD motif
MRQHRTAIIFTGAAALASFVAIGTGASAGAAPSYPTYGAAPNASSVTVAPTNAAHVATLATVHATKASVNGRTESILVNAKGLPLYYFAGDTAKQSKVSGALLHLWPALVATHPVGSGTPEKLAALQGANGHQVTYNGRFLYTFVDDTPGHVNGQGVSNFFVATPRLKSIAHSSVTAAVPTTSGSHGYGY